jgi:copper ion binding protein
MTTTRYPVRGMSCQHCVRAVEEAVRRLPGVERAEARLQPGEVRVTWRDQPDDDAVRRAVAEAGYEVA